MLGTGAIIRHGERDFARNMEVDIYVRRKDVRDAPIEGAFAFLMAAGDAAQLRIVQDQLNPAELAILMAAENDAALSTTERNVLMLHDQADIVLSMVKFRPRIKLISFDAPRNKYYNISNL